MSTTVHHDHSDLPDLLAQVPCAATTYDEWLNVGMGLKASGFTVDVWDAWSATDPQRYDAKTIRAKWDGFNGGGITGATVAKICFGHGAQADRVGVSPTVATDASWKEWEPPAEPEPDYSEGRKQHREYIDHAQAAMTPGCDGWNYLTRRGLTAETIERHRIGWNPRTRSVVMPYSTSEGEYYHIDRRIDVDTHTKHKYDKPRKEDVGEEPIFCAEDLEDGSDAVFVVEGGFDVYALHQLGYKAAGIISAKSYGRIVDRLKANGYGGTVIAMLDDDKTGNSAAEGLCKALEDAHIRHIRATQAPGTNDASEALEECPERFRAHMRKAYLQAVAGATATRLADVDATVSRILAGEGMTKTISTGLKSVDKALGGGFPEGRLISLGAVSSIGKTTLALQIADSIAESGRAVLFVTIEQSARELIEKSLARLTATAPGNRGLAATASELADPKRRAAWNALEAERLAQACEIYTERVAPRVNILEGIEQPSVSDVATLARSIAERDGEPPVVFIDYLQLLAAPNERDDDKRATDKNVMSLRHLARDLKTPVVVISSLNRASYSAGVTLEAFKESGAIEYGSDILLGLQPAGMYIETEGVAETKVKGKARKLMREHKAKTQRPCELVVLKNRNGATTDEGVPLTFDSPHGLWLEPQPQTPTQRADVPW